MNLQYQCHNNTIPLIEVTEIADIQTLKESVSLQNIEAFLNQSSQESSKQRLHTFKNLLNSVI